MHQIKAQWRSFVRNTTIVLAHWDSYEIDQLGVRHHAHVVAFANGRKIYESRGGDLPTLLIRMNTFMDRWRRDHNLPGLGLADNLPTRNESPPWRRFDIEPTDLWRENDKPKQG